MYNAIPSKKKKIKTWGKNISISAIRVNQVVVVELHGQF